MRKTVAGLGSVFVFVAAGCATPEPPPQPQPEGIHYRTAADHATSLVTVVRDNDRAVLEITPLKSNHTPEKFAFSCSQDQEILREAQEKAVAESRRLQDEMRKAMAGITPATMDAHYKKMPPLGKALAHNDLRVSGLREVAEACELSR